MDSPEPKPMSGNTFTKNDIKYALAEVEEELKNSNPNANVTVTMDNNNNINPIPPKDDKRAKDRDQRLADILQLKIPQPSGSLRRFTVFNLFHDFGRLIGLSKASKKKGVHFPEEVLEEYELKGDVAGNDRFVPRSKQPYRKPRTRRKKSLSIIIPKRSQEFLPRLERIEDSTPLEHWCERKFVSCECCNPKPVKMYVSKGKAVQTKVKLPDVTEGFLYSVNMAEQFITGHKMTTYTAALEILDLPLPLQNSSPPSSPSIDVFPTEHTSRMGVLAASLWIFTYSLPLLFENSQDLPSETAFNKLMEQYGTLALTVDEGCITLLQQAHDFDNYCSECMRVVRILQLMVDFEGETELREPIRRGSGLVVREKVTVKDIAEITKFKVMVTQEDEGEKMTWEDFSGCNASYKVSALKNLLQGVMEGFAHGLTQMRFLLDDIVESTIDPAIEIDLLFLLGDMYDRISFIESQPNNRIKFKELEEIKISMSHFTRTFRDFIGTGQHIMLKLLELRDVMQVCYEYITVEIGVELIKIVPEELFDSWKKKSRWEKFKAKFSCSCCVKTEDDVTQELFTPEYESLDFFRTNYQDILTCPVIISGNFCFQLRDTMIKADMNKKGSLRFSKSGPIPERISDGASNVTVPNPNNEVLPDTETVGRNSPTGSVDLPHQPEVPELKPILKSSAAAPESPEVPESDGKGRTTSNPEVSGHPEMNSGLVLSDDQNEKTKAHQPKAHFQDNP